MANCDGTTFSSNSPYGVTFSKEEADKWKLERHGYGYGDFEEFELDKTQLEFLKKELT